MYNHALLDDGDGYPTNDLHQLVIGTAGAPPYDWNGLYDGNNGPWTPQLVHHEEEYGYVLVEISDSNVTLTWKHRTAQGVYGVASQFAYTVTKDVPTVSEWGGTLMALLLGMVGIVMIERRRRSRSGSPLREPC